MTDQITILYPVIREYLLEKLANMSLNSYDKEQKQLYNVIKLLFNGESNSLLLIGPKGCEKEMVIKSVLKRLQEENLTENLTQVHLNGLIHTDDKIAVKSLSTQMNVKSSERIFANFGENLQYLLQQQNDDGKYVLFVLEDLQYFCYHDNQTLLYNLFEVVLNGVVPVCVIGVTSRLDIVELFEKRVKSRFSHRIINLLPPPNEAILNRILKFFKINSPLFNFWNEHVEKFFQNDEIVKHLNRFDMITKSDAALRTLLTEVLCECVTCLSVSKFEKLLKKEKENLILMDLSVLEIALLGAICQHDETFDQKPFNQEMIIQRFEKFSSSKFNAPRNVTQTAFQHLKQLEIILPVKAGAASNVGSNFQMFSLALRPQTLKQTFSKMNLPTDLMLWLK